MKILTQLFTAIALAVFTAPALAVPRLWILSGVTFADGGTASGSFVYDAETNTHSAVNITTTTGTSVAGSTYAFVCRPPCGSGEVATELDAIAVASTDSLPGQPVLVLISVGLTDAGGTVALRKTSFEARCKTANCLLAQSPDRDVNGGFLIASAPIVYPVRVGPYIAGTITTNGRMGPLLPTDIIAWNLYVANASNAADRVYNSAFPDTGVGCAGGECAIATANTLIVSAADALRFYAVEEHCSALNITAHAAFLDDCSGTDFGPGIPVPGTSSPLPSTGDLNGQTGINLNQHGLTGSWFEPVTSGQGLEVEVFPDLAAPGVGFAFVSWFTYDSAIGGVDRQRWYTLTGTVTSGEPTALLKIRQNIGGNFNALPTTAPQEVGTAILSFDSCTSGKLQYAFTDGTGRTGLIPLTRLTPNVTCSTTTPFPTNPDFAHSGNWYAPATSGQGFTVEFNPASGVFAAWYTYAPTGAAAGAAGQRWYTAKSGPFAPGVRSVPVQIRQTTGGIFDALTPPTTVQVGTGQLEFQSCTAATFQYNFTAGSSGGLAGTINLSRVGPVPPGCT